MMKESGSVFLTDHELAKVFGISIEEFLAIAHTLERKGFPSKDPVFKNRRYWPAVKAYLDRRYDIPPAR